MRDRDCLRDRQRDIRDRDCLRDRQRDIEVRHNYLGERQRDNKHETHNNLRDSHRDICLGDGQMDIRLFGRQT